ncbi:hypothetical protein UlMin_041627 [Ulmus minor]
MVSVCYLFLQGTMMIRPYCYTIWEAVQDFLNVKFKETGHGNMYFPQFIPYLFIEKEASHVEGFSLELALVTIGGGKELEEKTRGMLWKVQLTSETIVNHMFTQWIHSHRDLPLMVNQMHTKPFVRTLEFLWQEGHIAHATVEEAKKEAMQMIDVYTKFAYEQTAIPVIVGQKSKVETFAGAFTDENGLRQHVWQTSWAISTRFGGIIMTHEDDTGLMLPPRMAPIQVEMEPFFSIVKSSGTTTFSIYTTTILRHITTPLVNDVAIEKSRWAKYQDKIEKIVLPLFMSTKNHEGKKG